MASINCRAIDELNSIPQHERDKLREFVNQNYDLISQELDDLWSKYGQEGDICVHVPNHEKAKHFWPERPPMVKALIRVFEGSTSTTNQRDVDRKSSIYQKCFTFLNDLDVISRCPETAEGK